MLNEQEIIEKCRKGNREAQKLLYNTYAPIFLGICHRYVFEHSEAEDILQDGFLKILTKISDFKGKGSFEGWMKRIIINTAITHYHKNNKYHKNHYQIEEVREVKIKTTGVVDNEFSHNELLNIIKSLPTGYRMVFNLFAIEGYKHKEIAEIMGIDINTSKSQYSRARKFIRKKLNTLQKEYSKL